MENALVILEGAARQCLIFSVAVQVRAEPITWKAFHLHINQVPAFCSLETCTFISMYLTTPDTFCRWVDAHWACVFCDWHFFS